MNPIKYIPVAFCAAYILVHLVGCGPTDPSGMWYVSLNWPRRATILPLHFLTRKKASPGKKSSNKEKT